MVQGRMHCQSERLADAGFVLRTGTHTCWHHKAYGIMTILLVWAEGDEEVWLCVDIPKQFSAVFDTWEGAAENALNRVVVRQYERGK